MTFRLVGSHVMVDLETLGNGSNAVITSIGAAKFNTVGVTDSFMAHIDPESCVAAGLNMDVSTVLWWMKQSDAARGAFTQKGQPLHIALEEFAAWFPKDACLWGNGATFDNVILSNAYKAVEQKTPWPYWGDRCYRTVKNLFPDVKAPAFVGVAHNALDDAVHQARHLVLIAGGGYE
jgi:hypothetical protein